MMKKWVELVDRKRGLGSPYKGKDVSCLFVALCFPRQMDTYGVARESRKESHVPLDIERNNVSTKKRLTMVVEIVSSMDRQQLRCSSL